MAIGKNNTVSLEELFRGTTAPEQQAATPASQPAKTQPAQAEKEEEDVIHLIPTFKTLREGGNKRWDKIVGFFKPSESATTKKRSVSEIFAEIRTEVRKCFE